jgi:segregation and condensation protein B
MSIKNKIESLLFISAKPIAIKQLADLIKVEEGEIKQAGEELMADYKQEHRGVQIIKNGSKLQMVSSPDYATLIQEFIQEETAGELSRPSLEALTIIAYRGPISKGDLDRIRGVNCALILRNLLIRGLIEAKTDKSETFYNVTFDFIRFLGINDINELPDFERLHQNEIIDKILTDVEPELVNNLTPDTSVGVQTVDE